MSRICIPFPHRKPHAKTFTFYDSVQPAAIPKGAIAAVYVNGLYYASPGELTRFSRHLWIDVNASDPAANVLDVENGDATPQEVPQWVKDHVDHFGVANAISRLYCNLSTWPLVKAQVATLPKEVRATVRYWIANPTGVPHIVPGASATQYKWSAGYDVSLGQGDF